MTRRPVKRQLQFDPLEGRTLLSTAARPNFEAAMPSRLEQRQAMVERFQATQERRAAATPIRAQGTPIRAFNNGNGQNNGGPQNFNPQFQGLDIRDVNATFRDRRDGSIEYKLNFRSGDYRFEHRYTLDLDRQAGDVPGAFGPGLDRFQAIDVFFANVLDRLVALPPGTGSGDGGGDTNASNNGDVTAPGFEGLGLRDLSGRYEHRGDGRLEARVQFNSGDYRFDQDYEVRIRGGGRGGFAQGQPLAGIDSVAVFYETLINRLSRSVAAAAAGGGGRRG